MPAHTVSKRRMGKEVSACNTHPYPSKSVNTTDTKTFYLFLQLCNFLLVLCLKPLQLGSYPAQESPRCQNFWSLEAGVPENRVPNPPPLAGFPLASEAGCCHLQWELALGILGPRGEK